MFCFQLDGTHFMQFRNLMFAVNHGIQCSICKVGNIQGFRYKCQKCSNFNMCQNCFWQGKIIDNHRTEHEVKEYSTNVSHCATKFVSSVNYKSMS